MTFYKIVETDNFGGDYPDEKFVNLPPMERVHAEAVADAINSGFYQEGPRFWMARPEWYKLQPGFEP